MSLRLPHTYGKPPLGAILLILGIIIFSIFLYLTVEWDVYLVQEQEYDWTREKIAITNFRILATSSQDQITIKNSHHFTILLREFRVNGVDIAQGDSYLLKPGQSKTFVGNIGSGAAGDEFAYTVYAHYDDFDNSIANYEMTPNAKLKGRLE